ncbi:MAG: PQQ-binding-like beta-propeller repeat protein [Planctomycetes bacterium]|nr:PQQ-binding-like beta-propeller repeat protein [Planctomycetota bacterium]
MMKFTPTAPRLLLALLLTLGGRPSSALQDDEYQQKNTALLNWYPEEGEVVTRASTLAAAGRYVEALAIYDEALEKRPGTVVAVDKARARGLREYVMSQIAAWPEEGKAAYRRRADPLAENLFQGAKRSRDVEALDRLVDQFPFSAVVDDALALIANLRLDAGENAAAAEALGRLLDREGGADRSVGIARLGLAWARAGRKGALEDLIRRVDREAAGSKVRVGGNEVALADHLKALAAGATEKPADAAPLALPAWEMIGGGPAGSRMAEPGIELAKSAWVDLIGLPRLDGEDEFMMRRTMALVPTAEYRPLFPAVSDGILYVHNGLALTAYNFFARQPERLWQFKVPTPSGEVMFDNRVVFAPMVHDGRVYANLISSVGGEENQLGYVRVKFPFPRRALFAFDAYTGKLLWKLGGKLNAETLEENATFATAPTPDGGRLYVGAVKQKLSTDPFQHYVLCLDPATGKILWSTYVASGGTEINLFGNSTRESLGSPVSVTEDSVYYCSNHGAIAALDKKSGRIRWTYRYRQLQVMPTRSVYVQKNRLEWVNAPPVVSLGTAAFTPTDSHYLYALDAQTGQLRWDRPRGQDVRMMYGARESTLVLGGERLELCDLSSGRSVSPPMTDELRGTGRGVLSSDGIYVPGQDKLRRVGWDGTWDETAARRWPGGLGDGGNLIVVDGAVVLASQDSVQVYFDRRDQERAIVEALERSPDDPAVLYRGALRYLQSGDAPRAAELLAKTVARTAKSARPEDEKLQRAARKRLFAVSMEAGRAELELGRPAQAAEHFAAARATAADLPARVEASIQLARVRLIRKDDAGAVGEYQRLLLEHGEESVEGARVFDLARNAIQATLAVVGRGAYAAHEEAAQALLAEARRAKTADALQKVFRLYPNSKAAEDALFETAAAHAMLDRHEEEQIAALRQFLRECSESARAPEATARLVRALEAKGHNASAGALLRRMIRQFPDAPVEEGGTKIPAREFAERRLKSDAYARAPGGVAISRLSLPPGGFKEENKLVLSDKDFPDGALPLRTVGLPPAGLGDVAFLHYVAPGSVLVKAVDVVRGAEVWRLKLGTQARFAAFLEESLLVADDLSLRRLNPRTGAVEWEYDSKARMHGFVLSGPLVLFLVEDPDARIVALEAVRGSIAWHQPFEGVAPSRIYPAGEAVAFTALNPNQIHLFEVETGKRLLTNAPFPQGSTANVVHVGDDVLVLHSEGRFLEAYDLPSGKLRWRQLRTRIVTRSIEVAGEDVITLGTQRPAPGIDERLFLEAVSLRTGKIVRQKEPRELGNALFMRVDGDQAVVVSREPDKSVTVRGVALSDFSVRWTTPLGGKDATLLPPDLARDHLVLGAFVENPKAVKYSYTAWLLDKSGRVVQNIPSGEFERPPAFLGVAHNRLIICVENKVEVLR